MADPVEGDEALRCKACGQETKGTVLVPACSACRSHFDEFAPLKCGCDDAEPKNCINCFQRSICPCHAVHEAWATDGLKMEEDAAKEAAESLREEVASLQEKLREAEAAIRDIDAHATPVGTGETPDYYAVTVGALHRALALTGAAAKCSAVPCPRAEKVEAALEAAKAENRVLTERCLRFVEIARMVREAFRNDDAAAMMAFGSNAVAHLAAQAEREEIVNGR